jgi:hypothetical protein
MVTFVPACKDPATLSMGSVLSCQLTTPKRIGLESPSVLPLELFRFAPAAGLGDHLKLSDRTTLYRIAFGLPLHSANLTEVGEVGIFSWQLPTFRCLP